MGRTRSRVVRRGGQGEPTMGARSDWGNFTAEFVQRRQRRVPTGVDNSAIFSVKRHG
ncbi:hypothetical protein Csa_003770 [Cucumis sativus]|uniref:Uncharacterized protein n=1 Tax=Cucumis sativus TaxID=3659 RepID=A0A0A0KFV5_CUCSA|nr:hypothetical protein Csa_003770 [Cucumis sativus]